MSDYCLLCCVLGGIIFYIICYKEHQKTFRRFRIGLDRADNSVDPVLDSEGLSNQILMNAPVGIRLNLQVLVVLVVWLIKKGVRAYIYKTYQNS